MMKRIIIAAILATCSMLNIMASYDNISGAWHGTLKITPQGVKDRVQFQDRRRWQTVSYA